MTMLRRTVLLSALLAVVMNAETGPCQPITLSQCQALPYKTTPTSGGGFEGSSQTAVGKAIDARTNSILDTNCSRVLTLVACAAYLPPCHSVAVSADMCRLAQTDCHHALVQLGIAWPEQLSCDTSPTDDQPTDGKSRRRGCNLAHRALSDSNVKIIPDAWSLVVYRAGARALTRCFTGSPCTPNVMLIR